MIYTNSVSATDTFLTLAKANGGGDLVNRTFTTQYAKDPANPKWDNDAAMKLYKTIMAKYYPKGRVTDAPEPLRGRRPPRPSSSSSTAQARTRRAPR